MMSSEPGFRIGAEFFPMSDSYTLGDTVLIRRVTGMGMSEFAECLMDEARQADAMAGLVAVAVARRYPSWPAEKVTKYVFAIDFADLESVAGEDVGGDVVDPPAVAAEGEPVLSPPSWIRSTNEPEFLSEPVTLSGTGHRG